MKSPLGLPKKSASQIIAEKLADKTAAPYDDFQREEQEWDYEVERREQRREEESSAMEGARQDWWSQTDLQGAAVKIQEVIETIAGMEAEGIEPFTGMEIGEDWRGWYKALEQALVALQNMERAK